jgi:hypothetical protein
MILIGIQASWLVPGMLHQLYFAGPKGYFFSISIKLFNFKYYLSYIPPSKQPFS